MNSRKIEWLSSIDNSNDVAIANLERALSDFYSSNNAYYGAIDFTAANWTSDDEEGYKYIVGQIRQRSSICEVGCGNANLLKAYPEFQARYKGCDFSRDLLSRNKQLYPDAEFKTFAEANTLPFSDGQFDLLFSVFVLEHSTRPAKLLDECARVLKPGGKFLLLCPDFLSQGRMTSQRLGWSSGTATQKLKSGKILDAMVSLFDSRIRVPLVCRRLASSASRTPKFFVNISPVVFQDTFSPDVDAVYVTFKKEIQAYLEDRFELVDNTDDLRRYEENKKLIFLEMIKK